MLKALFLAAVAYLATHSPVARMAGPGTIPSRIAAMPGEREVKALAAAWPGQVDGLRLQAGEWQLQIGEQWFSWSEGRLLPLADAGSWQDYAPLPFYSYPLSLPPLPTLDPDTAAALRHRVAAEERDPPRRSEAFLGALLSARNRVETESRLVKMEVAGFTVSVHGLLKGPLTRVSAELAALKASDPEVAAFLRSLAEMNGYNYRFVENTRSRSLHSYGIAVDLIPKSYGGRDTYWLWAMNRVSDWWTVPYERRWMPPSAVIAAFERQGFVWGGKWLFFDTMHFEYRPDILLLARSEIGPPTVADLPES
jgi:hypothetical protein